MKFVVKRQFGGRGPETAIAEFEDMNEANFYIEKRMESDASQNLTTTVYRIYDRGVVVVKEYDPSKMNLSSSQEQGSQGKDSTASFRPTPLSTTLTMGPKNWVKENKDDKDKQK